MLGTVGDHIGGGKREVGEDRVGQGGIADQVLPMLDRQLAGDEGGALAVAIVEQFEQKLPFYRGRHAVRPGITGWAQLCYPYGANEQDALEKLQYDLYYVKNRSVIFDLAIMMQTVEVVLWQKGAR